MRMVKEKDCAEKFKTLHSSLHRFKRGLVFMMRLLKRSLVHLQGAFTPAFIHRLTAVETAQEKTRMDLTRLQNSVTTLQNTVTTGMTEIKADVKRLSDKIGAGETVTQADLDALADRIDAVNAAVSQTVTDVDTTTDAAAGQDTPADPTPVTDPAPASDPAPGADAPTA